MDPASILRYRLAANHLSSPLREGSLAAAAHVGLQDGSPWSGLLSLHARAGGVHAGSWRDPTLVQVFGPRGAVYLVPTDDIAIFTLGVFPVAARHAEKVRRDADDIRRLLAGGSLSQSSIVEQLPHLGGRDVRYAGTTGTLTAVWDTTTTIVSEVPPPEMDVSDARRELARRFFRYLGPASVDDLQWFMGTSKRAAVELIEDLGDELAEVNGFLVTAATSGLFESVAPPPPLLLLPPDDPALNRRTTRRLVPDEAARLMFHKSPPPGIIVADGKPIGTWRRRSRHVRLHPWQPISDEQVQLAERLVAGFPLPGSDKPRVTIDPVQD